MLSLDAKISKPEWCFIAEKIQKTKNQFKIYFLNYIWIGAERITIRYVLTAANSYSPDNKR